MKFSVAPSLLSADFLHLERDVRMLNESDADILHLDIMDGTFVPNISFGFPVVKAIASATHKTLDAHLMVVHPERWFKTLADIGAEMVSFHQEEARERTAQNIDEIHALGMKAGVVVNPDIPVENLFPYIGKADFFLIMSVFAGFGGQKFIPESLDKVRALRAAAGPDAVIEIDGGVNASNIRTLKDAGVNIAVAGSAVFGAPDQKAEIRKLLAL